MVFHVITIFPEIFNSYFGESILKRAQEKKIIKILTYDLRKWTSDKHKTVDDTPYGGGAGMVMKVEPLYKAIKDIKRKIRKGRKIKVILFSAKGRTWNQQMVEKNSDYDDLIMVCGRYEGIDERVLKYIDEEISIGDYVLTGGEIPAMVVVDSIARLLPGSLGNTCSSEDESHSSPGILEYAQYTRPEVFEADGLKLRVPKILLSGDHKKIIEWKESKKTKKKKLL